jgi:L-iditol 2-dehydrogenase
VRAALFYGPRDVRVEEVPIPSPGPGEILVRVRAATTCGTDVKAYVRGYPGLIPPSPFGHEFSGVIEALGPGVPEVRPDLQVGTRVAVANSSPCHHCSFCRIGELSLCEQLRFLWGAFAEYVRVPAGIVRDNVYLIPQELSHLDAALMEPLACVVHGVDRSPIRLGDTVVVLGAGPIGLMYVRLLKLRGARVIVCDPSPFRLTVATRLGADHVIATPDPEVQLAAVRDLTEGGRGADVVIEAVGLPEVWEQAIRLVRKGGTVNLFGGPKPGTTITLDTNRIHYGMITLKAVFHHTPDTCQRALRLIVRRDITAEIFVSELLPLERTPEALERHQQHNVVKVGIIPDDDPTAR